MATMTDLSALNLEPGQVVGGYTLMSRLGGGAMGSVWKVSDDGGQTYAMKILRDSLADDDDEASADPDLKENVSARERLRREAMALKKVNNPGVCGIVDMELDDSLAFIVTELIDGRNLKDDVAVNGKYTGEDLERLARKLIEAVKAVHAAGIVHRDIKPTNVMVSAHGPVLVDFGIAMGEGESHVTRTGLVMGTPGFIAPEIIDGEDSDEATDWWSTASVLAFAATGEPVFGTKPMMAVLERAAAGSANLTGLPATTMAAFRAALAPQREHRCTPDQLLQAIALDAWSGNPLGGNVSADHSSNSSNDSDGSEAMPPFPRSSDEENPRLVWRDDNDADIIRTEAMAAETLTTQVIDESGHTKAMPTASEAATQALAASADATTPIATSSADAQQSQSRDALQRLVDRSDQAMQQTAAEQSTFESQSDTSTQPMAAVPTVNAVTSANAVAPAAPTAPIQTVDQAALTATGSAVNQAQPAAQPVIMANPADLRRGAYVKHSIIVLLILAIPLAITAAFQPYIALAAAAVLLWVLLVLGCNTESQLEREGKRGGQRKGSDAFLRAASLPWHIVKGFGLMIPHFLLLALIMVGGTALTTALLHLPYHFVHLSLWQLDIPIPMLTDGAFTTTGLTLAGFMIIAWLVTVFGPSSLLIRLGAGVLRGPVSSGTSYNDAERETQGE